MMICLHVHRGYILLRTAMCRRLANFGTRSLSAWAVFLQAPEKGKAKGQKLRPSSVAEYNHLRGGKIDSTNHKDNKTFLTDTISKDYGSCSAKGRASWNVERGVWSVLTVPLG
eukprot:1383147-Amorphochlora_amoeboformis.AAC.2